MLQFGCSMEVAERDLWVVHFPLCVVADNMQQRRYVGCMHQHCPFCKGWTFSLPFIGVSSFFRGKHVCEMKMRALADLLLEAALELHLPENRDRARRSLGREMYEDEMYLHERTLEDCVRAAGAGTAAERTVHLFLSHSFLRVSSPPVLRALYRVCFFTFLFISSSVFSFFFFFSPSFLSFHPLSLSLPPSLSLSVSLSPSP